MPQVVVAEQKATAMPDVMIHSMGAVFLVTERRQKEQRAQQSQLFPKMNYWRIVVSSKTT